MAMLGALQHLGQAGELGGVTTYVGTSAGGVVATVLALGIAPITFFNEHVLHFKYVADIDIGLLDKKLGLDSGRGLEAWLAAFVPEDLTFRSLHAATRKKLVLCATNLNTKEADYLSLDTTPDLSVRKALRMSCGVPLYFAAVQHEGCVYIDGAIRDNVPIECAVRAGGLRILALCFHVSQKPPGSTWGLAEFLGSMLEASVAPRAVPAGVRVLKLHTGGISPLQFKATAQQKQQLFDDGYRQARVFFKKDV